MDYQKIISRLYKDFNDRNIDTVLALTHTNVTWPNGWEGGYLHGHDEVRAYWLRQWQEINPKVLPTSFQTRSDGEIAIGVHQIVKDLNGQVLSDGQVTHVYTFEDGKVRKMVIE
ncbi:nuclear transport factor 2 family protein [Dyadobacter psychrotolerans]|uniref:Nuclear transport factor 2 family protein n=1 Tax=Dyadobacter psychrotolerans TaxID=2541721 RepID=A0A4R5DHC7_9BACT|nr:nuclear transport factor 2 family protein [Dyadobacter psychrotolerans]TDE11264.1 nuclear transport factor 2 family protein [Dyadobacter psychrotolerans]